MDAGGARAQGDRWDEGKAGERDVQSLLASEQYKCACLPPLPTASTLEAWCNWRGDTRHQWKARTRQMRTNAQRSGAAGSHNCLITVPVQ